MKLLFWLCFFLSTTSNTMAAGEPNIGAPDEVWQKVQSGGREIYVQTNGAYGTNGVFESNLDSGATFRTYVVTNLPESYIVGAPQSVMNDVRGDCNSRTFQVLGSLFFAEKNRSGMAMHSLPVENIERKLVPNSPFEKAFNLLCKIAKDKNR